MQYPYDGDVIRLDLRRKPEHVALIERVYEEIYMPAFPIAEERQTLDYMKSRLQFSDDAPREYAAIVAGRNLNDPVNADVDSMSLGIYYKEAQAGLMAYNATRPEAQGRGLGRIMVDARRIEFERIASRLGHAKNGPFLEINDPEKTVDDVMSPRKRLSIFQGWGAVALPIDYVQPPLDPHSGKYDGLILLSYPNTDGLYPTPHVAEAFLREMYVACGRIPPENDPDFVNMQRQLRRISFNAAAKGAEVYASTIVPLARMGVAVTRGNISLAHGPSGMG